MGGAPFFSLDLPVSARNESAGRSQPKAMASRTGTKLTGSATVGGGGGGGARLKKPTIASNVDAIDPTPPLSRTFPKISRAEIRTRNTVTDRDETACTQPIIMSCDMPCSMYVQQHR